MEAYWAGERWQLRSQGKDSLGHVADLESVVIALREEAT